MQKIRIKVRADLAVCADAHEAAWLKVKDRCDNLSDMADNDGKVEIDSPNVGLIEFGI